MPARKARLSPAEEAEYFNCLRELEAAGIDVDMPQRYLERARSLDIFIAGGPATFIFDLRGGGAAFAIWVRLVAPCRITILDATIETTWDDQIVLQGFFDERPTSWWLGKLDFPRARVLNMRIMDGLTLNPGAVVEGWILAVGLRPMPEAFCHGMSVPFTLALLDQYENEIKEDATLYADRTWKKKTKYVRRESLFGPAATATDEPVVRHNLNGGPVTDPESDIPDQSGRQGEK